MTRRQGQPAPDRGPDEAGRGLGLGSGGGVDVLFPARRDGPAGTAYGPDRTEEALALAPADQDRAGRTDAATRPGEIGSTRGAGTDGLGA